MTHLCSRSAQCSALVLFLLAHSTTAIERRAISEQDLFAFAWVADPQISPDGSRVAFVRVTADKQKDVYETAVWVVSTDGRQSARPLTVGPRDLAPRWSPDGGHLAFLRSVEREGRPQPAQIYVLPLEGGEPRVVTNMPHA